MKDEHMIDLQAYYRKLANNEAVTPDKVQALLKELNAFRQGAAYLASCQAATLDGLPKSFSKSGRARHISICKLAAEVMVGNVMSIRHPTTPEAARARCLNVVQRAEEDAQDAQQEPSRESPRG